MKILFNIVNNLYDMKGVEIGKKLYLFLKIIEKINEKVYNKLVSEIYWPDIILNGSL